MFPRCGHQLGKEDLTDGEIRAGLAGRSKVVGGAHSADADKRLGEHLAESDERIQCAVGGEGVLEATNARVPHHLGCWHEVLSGRCAEDGDNRPGRQRRGKHATTVRPRLILVQHFFWIN